MLSSVVSHTNTDGSALLKFRNQPSPGYGLMPSLGCKILNGYPCPNSLLPHSLGLGPLQTFPNLNNSVQFCKFWGFLARPLSSNHGVLPVAVHLTQALRLSSHSTHQFELCPESPIPCLLCFPFSHTIFFTFTEHWRVSKGKPYHFFTNQSFPSI